MHNKPINLSNFLLTNQPFPKDINDFDLKLINHCFPNLINWLNNEKQNLTNVENNKPQIYELFKYYFTNNINKNQFCLDDLSLLCLTTKIMLKFNIGLDNNDIFEKYILPLDKKYHLNLFLLFYNNFFNNYNLNLKEKNYFNDLIPYDANHNTVKLPHMSNNYLHFFNFNSITYLPKESILLDCLLDLNTQKYIIDLLLKSNNLNIDLKNKTTSFLNEKKFLISNLSKQIIKFDNQQKINSIFFSENIIKNNNFKENLLFILNPNNNYQSTLNLILCNQAIFIAFYKHFSFSLPKTNILTKIISPDNSLIEHSLNLFSQSSRTNKHYSKLIKLIPFNLNDPTLKPFIEKHKLINLQHNNKSLPIFNNPISKFKI